MGMADDPTNPFARESAWPRMPNAPMRIGPLPKPRPETRPPETPRAITPVFTRPAGMARAPLAEITPPPEPVSSTPELVVATLRSAPVAGRNWLPLALAAGIAGVVALGSAVFLTREPAPSPEPRLAAAIVEPAPAPPVVAAAVAEPKPAPRPARVAAATRRAPAPSPEPQAPSAIELGAPLEIPPVAEAPPTPEPVAPPPVDPEAPITTKPPY
jgi:hypothetical protein